MRYFSMFSGIGGFERGIERAYSNKQSAEVKQNRQGRNGDPDEAGGDVLPSSRTAPLCVGFSELNKYAIQIYQRHFPGHKNYGDATRIVPEEIPEFDFLCGGFPCQAFSIAGKRGGFKDTRGTLFFEIARILAVKRPKLLLLENVKGLLSHDRGRTFGTILATLSELGYICEWQVLNSKDFGVPQNRERVFIVGHLGGEGCGKVFPVGEINEKTCRELTEGMSQGYRVYDPDGVATTLASQAGGVGAKTGLYQISNSSDREFGFKDLSPCLQARDYKDPKIVRAVLTPDRLEKRQNGRRMKTDGEPAFTVTAQDKHGVYDGMRIRRLTPLECERLQGFPDGWTEGISDSQRYKCLGNAVTVNVIEAIMDKIIDEFNQ